MDYNDYLHDQDDDILSDDEIYLLDDNNIIDRMEAQNKRKKEPIIKRNIDKWN
jgi:hypothetical protein